MYFYRSVKIYSTYSIWQKPPAQYPRLEHSDKNLLFAYICNDVVAIVF